MFITLFKNYNYNTKSKTNYDQDMEEDSQIIQTLQLVEKKFELVFINIEWK